MADVTRPFMEALRLQNLDFVDILHTRVDTGESSEMEYATDPEELANITRMRVGYHVMVSALAVQFALALETVKIVDKNGFLLISGPVELRPGGTESAPTVRAVIRWRVVK
jgi:hypothetical protein